VKDVMNSKEENQTKYIIGASHVDEKCQKLNFKPSERLQSFTLD